MKQIDDLLSEQSKNLFNGYQIKEPTIMCKHCGHQLKRLCASPWCEQFSLFCLNDTCEKSYQKHDLCNINIALKGITELLKQHFSKNRQFLEKMMKIEDGLIEKLTKNKEEVIKRLSSGNLQSQYERAVNQIYRKGNGQYLRGKQASQFLAKLVFLSKVKSNSDVYLSKFEVAVNNIFRQLIYAKEGVLNQYLSSIKSVNQFSVVGQEFDSVILKKDSAKYQENLAFIFQSLESPKRLQLLFRASEHQFLASKFHEKCDNINQTFTIIRTEFGKTIAGYNHFKWNTAKDGYLIDNEKKCFLLSIELKQKMALIDQTQAIQNNQTYGPTFGENDIFISNQCNLNNHSYANFPFSYNFAAKPYIRNQTTYNAILGSRNDCYFKVAQYEVYRVIR